jgi:hypothetical protein
MDNVQNKVLVLMYHRHKLLDLIVHLISLRHQYKYLEHKGKKTIETDGHKLLLNTPKLVGIGRCDRIPDHRGIFQLGHINSSGKKI